MPKAEKNSQSEKAMLELRLMVLNGDFGPNSRLREVALSEKLGISRTPLRQAMSRLTEEGLLERVDTGGYKVAHFSLEDIFDAIELRGVMEGTSARLAAERGANPKLLEGCEHTLDDLDIAINTSDTFDFDSYVSLNTRFHQQLSELSDSRIIQRELKRAMRLPLSAPSSFLQGQEMVSNFHSSLMIAQHQHRSILQAIIKREGARAESLSREHARLSRQNLDYVMKLNPSIAQQVPGIALVSSI